MEGKEIIYPEFKGIYIVYRDGSIYNKISQRFIKVYERPKPYNYCTVTLISDKHTIRHVYIHNVIADHFLIKPINKYERYEVNHIDNNKANNNVDNLEYITHQMNILKARQMKHWDAGRKPGFKATDETKRKQSISKYKPVIAYNNDTKLDFESIESLCVYFNTYRKTFNRFVNSHKTYKSFYIRYKDSK